MASYSLAVLLHSKKIGVLRIRENFSRFILDQEYISDPDRDMLGLAFEQNLSAQLSSNIRLPAWFSNLLPEGKLREWIAEDRKVSSSREIELITQVGHDLPGAVQVVEMDEVSCDPTEESDHSATSSQQEPNDRNIWRFSLAGVALKFSMIKRHNGFTAPAVGEGGDWIVKLPDERHHRVPLNEFAMMSLAKLCGIDTPTVKLLDRDQLASIPQSLWPRQENQAYAIQRFDRTEFGKKRVHIEDLAQVRGFYPDEKYSGSFETVAALIYRGHDSSSLAEFARRLAFNILIGNGDAHLKNWSLIYENKKIPRLSPAYDLVATAVYRPDGVPEDLGLKLCGSRRFESISLSSFARLQERIGASDVDLAGEARDVIEKVQKYWPQVEELLAEVPQLRDGISLNISKRSKSLLSKEQI